MNITKKTLCSRKNIYTNVQGNIMQDSQKWKVKVLVAQVCPTLCDPVGCSPAGSFIHGLPRQEYWSGLPFPAPEDLPDPGVKPGPPPFQADSLPCEPPAKSSPQVGPTQMTLNWRTNRQSVAFPYTEEGRGTDHATTGVNPSNTVLSKINQPRKAVHCTSLHL